MLVGGVLLRLTDTAGIRDSGDRIEAMGVERSRQAAQRASLALLVLDGSQALSEEDEQAIAAAQSVPNLLVLVNKGDLPRRLDIGRLADRFDNVLTISARTGDGLDDLMAQLQIYATAGPQLFPDGMTTDQPDAQVCAEIVREKMLLCLEKEIPHGTAVEITRFTEREDTGIIDLDVTIYCEKASHKGIIIGKHGAMLKRISSLARRDIEKFMGAKVYMETWVKVKENWRDNVNFIRARGYDEQ